MRVTIKVDSATPEEVYDLTDGLQRYANVYGAPHVEGVVTVVGAEMGWQSPPIRTDYARSVLQWAENMGRHRAAEPALTGTGV